MNHNVFSDGTAAVAKYLKESASPLDGIAFIGHALLTTTPPCGTTNYSVGLVFADGWLVRTPNQPPDPNNPCYNYGFDPPPTYRAQIPTDAKIIFIAACDDFNGVLGSLWNITNGTQGQALVMPDLSTTPDNIPGSVDLWQGAVEWEQIDINLAAGQTIQQAVADANQYIKANPAMFVTGYSQAWLIVGDPNVKLKP